MTLTQQEQKWVDQKIGVSREVDLDCLNLDQIVETFTSFADEHGVEINEITVDIDTYQGYYGDSASYSCYLRANRNPTDQERLEREENILREKQRVAQNRKRDKISREEKDRKEYERLKKKFERGSIKAAE
jgi:hypothetical protein